MMDRHHRHGYIVFELCIMMIMVINGCVSSSVMNSISSTIQSAHSMQPTNVCHMLSNGCCNGLSCPYKDAVCCQNGRHCCPSGSECMSSSDDNGAPRCGFRSNTISNQQQQQPHQCMCSSSKPRVCPCSPAISSQGRQGVVVHMNPVAQQITTLTKNRKIIPESVWAAYNDVVSPVIVSLRMLGYNLGLYAPGTPQRFRFTRQVIHDVATALAIPDTQLRVKNLTSGSIIVNMEISAPAEGHPNQQSPEQLARNLRRMVKDSFGPLAAGRVTRFADHNYFHKSVVWESMNAARQKQRSSNTNPIPQPPEAPSGYGDDNSTSTVAPTPPPVATDETGFPIPSVSATNHTADSKNNDLDVPPKEKNQNDSSLLWYVAPTPPPNTPPASSSTSPVVLKFGNK